MIYARLKGGLGNQMFQYVAGLRMASMYKDTLKLDVTGYEEGGQAKYDTLRNYRLKAFTLSSEVATSEEALRARNPYGIVSKVLRRIDQSVFKNTYSDYHPEYFAKKHRYVEGYFQCEKNFGEVKEKIREEFKLKKEYESKEYSELKKIIQATTGVSVHIRRGDYAKDKITNAYFGTCSIEYYKQAMNLIREKVDSPIFYFFSDDIEWVKSEFGRKEEYVFVSNPKLEDYEELLLMSTCAHNIIANSSFSWWGAWLNANPHKIIVAPKKWLNVEPNPQPNIIPEGWITI